MQTRAPCRQYPNPRIQQLLLKHSSNITPPSAVRLFYLAREYPPPHSKVQAGAGRTISVPTSSRMLMLLDMGRIEFYRCALV